MSSFLQYNKRDTEFKLVRPSIPQHIQLLFKNSKGCKDFYIIQFHKNNLLEYSFAAKWNRDLNLTIDIETWKHVFSCCFNPLYFNLIMGLRYTLSTHFHSPSSTNCFADLHTNYVWV